MQLLSERFREHPSRAYGACGDFPCAREAGLCSPCFTAGFSSRIAHQMIYFSRLVLSLYSLDLLSNLPSARPTQREPVLVRSVLRSMRLS